MSELTENQWQIAHIMARLLVQEKMDKNELKKAIAYLRTYVEAVDGGERFLNYLQSLINDGDKIGHSYKTVNYYRSLNKVCVKYLQPLQSTPQSMLDILGWVGRLIHYYEGNPIAELMDAPIEVTVMSSRQAELAQAAQSMNWSIGMVVTANITNIDGNKVTYTLPEKVKISQKEPKRFRELSVGDVVQVEIVELHPTTGLPKKVKIVD
jgi:hypothetical protein